LLALFFFNFIKVFFKKNLKNFLQVIDESGNCLNPSQRGEICVKSSVSFGGYFNDPINSVKAVDPDGWLYTGDIGFISKDGFVYIEERKKFMLKNYGYYITPLEIESVINEVNGVLESCVVGIYDENEGNDIIFGFVLKDENFDLSEEEIEKYANEKLSAAKKIRGGIYFVDKFPLSSNGKIVRKSLMEICKNKLNEKFEREMMETIEK
jgi:acyl-CoA synthetase (AMP-forming)/AMP-acid ligase II